MNDGKNARNHPCDLTAMMWLVAFLRTCGGDELHAIDRLGGITVSLAGQLFVAAYPEEECLARFAEVAEECDLWTKGHEGEWGPMEWILAASYLLEAAHERFALAKARGEARVQ